jgi:hypothetical protein
MMAYVNTLELLLAKQDMADVMARYARGVDRADATLLHSCYWDDAIEEHGSSYSGPARAYVDGAVERLRRGGTICHYACNMHFEFDEGGTIAWVETYLLTFARFEKEGEPFDTLTGGRIVDRFERRDGEWRIAHRKMAFDWNRDAPTSEGWCLGLFKPEDPRMVMGRKGQGDLSYSRF